MNIYKSHFFRVIIILPIKWLILNFNWASLFITFKINKKHNFFFNNNKICFNKFFLLHNHKTIFVCKTDYLEKELIRIAKIKHEVILITGNSDFPIDNKYLNKIPENVKKWYAQNAILNHPKVISIPLGLENFSIAKRRGHGITYKRAKTKLKLLNRDLNIALSKFIYANFVIKTNTEYRQHVYDIIKDLTHIDFEEPNLSIRTFFNKIIDYKMVLCPIGNGIDTHRLWEVLYTKRVPIIIRIKDCKIFELYSQLPIIILELIEDLKNVKLIENLYLNVLSSKYNTDILNYSYWETMILNDN